MWEGGERRIGGGEKMDLSGARGDVEERKTVLRMHRATDVLSTLHNTASGR